MKNVGLFCWANQMSLDWALLETETLYIDPGQEYSGPGSMEPSRDPDPRDYFVCGLENKVALRQWTHNKQATLSLFYFLI